MTKAQRSMYVNPLSLVEPQSKSLQTYSFVSTLMAARDLLEEIDTYKNAPYAQRITTFGA